MQKRMTTEKEGDRRNTKQHRYLQPMEKTNQPHTLFKSPEELLRATEAGRIAKHPNSHPVDRTCMITGCWITSSKVLKRGLFQGDNHSDEKLSYGCSPNRTKKN